MNQPTSQMPSVYIYLDNVGIESLYAQTVDRIEIEMRSGREMEKGGKLTAKMGIGSLLGKVVDIGSSGEFSMIGKYVEEAKTMLTPEHKLSALLRYLTDFSLQGFYQDLPKAAIACTESNRSVFVHAIERFNLPQFYRGMGVDEVNRDKIVDFEIGPMRRYDNDYYQHSDGYFKKKHYHFYMSASLTKFTRVHDETMGASCHEAVLFRATSGIGVLLGVFGSLKHLVNLEYQIKPYAIWV